LLEAREIPAAGSWLLSSNMTASALLGAALTSASTFSRHYPNIRIAELAYNGNPMGPTELGLLKNSVDLVVPNVRYLPTIAAATPRTPQLVYTNISNLYGDLLSDWLAYADRHNLPRESAFFHAAAATPFTGDSPSSQPVTWFWNVADGPTAGTSGFISRTVEAHGGKAGGIPFGGAGQAAYIGYPEPFREINVVLSVPATGAWTDILEYPVAVDAAGRPTVWKPLAQIGDTTNGLRNSGILTFDPPANWVPAVVPGSTARLYYVRVRAGGNAADAPAAMTLLGHDYVNAHGTSAGVIPAFDTTADVNHDGYLSDAEYANRRPGFDARFLYESRLFYPQYGQMRFLTNPSGVGVAPWAAAEQKRLLATNPLAAGIFVDNSGGKFPAAGLSVVEPTSAYASSYALVLGTIRRAIAPKLVLANTSGGGAAADVVAAQVSGTIEESALRPMSQTWSQFTDLAGIVASRLGATRAGFLILDSLSAGGSPTDPRTQMAALSEYYLLADPVRTLFMPWGGEEPASSWSRHWWWALGFDIGKPTAGWSLFASGPDPANPALAYQVLQRQYGKALVLYKPLSYTLGQGTGTTADNTATVLQLGGNYRMLNADGSLGPMVRSVTLRNGQGAVLVRA
jgi:hypothetical protein